MGEELAFEAGERSGTWISCIMVAMLLLARILGATQCSQVLLLCLCLAHGFATGGGLEVEEL